MESPAPPIGCRSVSDLLARFAEVRHDSPDRVLIHLLAVTRWSADDLWEAHERYAERLTRTGVGSGELVVSAAGNSPVSVPFLLACRALDAVVMPVEAGTRSSSWSRWPSDSARRRSFCRRSSSRIHGWMRVIATALDAGLRIFSTVDIERRGYRGSAMIKLTSGSTGVPKATVTTDAQLIADSTQIMTAMQIGPSDVQIAAIPLSHWYGLGCVLLPLMLQGTAFVLHGSFVPQQMPGDVRRFGARVFAGVPFMFEYFPRQPADGGRGRSVAPADVSGRTAHAVDDPLVPRTLRGENPLLLRHVGNRRHRL